MKLQVRQRGDTFTAIWYTIDPATGARKQRSKGGFASREEAEDHLLSVLPKVRSGSWVPDEALTVRQLLVDHWLPAKLAEGIRPTTAAQYGHVIDDWLLPHLGAIKARSVTPATVRDLVSTLTTAKSSQGRKGLSARSAQLAVVTLKAAFRWAHENEMIPRNPIARVKRPAAPRTTATRDHAWTADEARTFLNTTATDRLAVAWALLLTRGLRRGELCGLRWGAVDLDARTLRIEETLVVAEGKAQLSAPKTEGSRRTIALDDALVTLLRSHRAHQAEERAALGRGWPTGADFVIADELGDPCHPESISTRFETLVNTHGLRLIRLHDLRHTAASLMLAAGEQVKVVQEMMGHSSPSITLGIYGHVMPGESEKAGAKLSNLLLG